MTRNRAKASRTRLGRRPGTNNTREEILAAARTLFAEQGYSGTSLRDIAAKANVEVSLLAHYFGSKDELFTECTHTSIAAFHAVRAAFQGPAYNLGERVVSAYLACWENPDTAEPLRSVARSLFTYEHADDLLSEYTRILVCEFVRHVNTKNIEHTEARITTAFATLLGVALSRYVLRVDPLAALDTTTLVTIMAPTVQAALVPNNTAQDRKKAGVDNRLTSYGVSERSRSRRLRTSLSRSTTSKPR